MGHIQIFGEEFRDKLHAGLGEEELIKWVKDQVLQSFKNGLAQRATRGEEGQKPSERSGKSRGDDKR